PYYTSNFFALCMHSLFLFCISSFTDLDTLSLHDALPILSRPNLVSTPFCAISQVSTGQYLSWTKYLLAFVLPKPAGGDSITPTGHRICLPSARSLAEDCRLLR